MKALLLILVAIVALTTLASGLLMIYRPEGDIINIGKDILRTTPFTNFLLPGILLTIIGSIYVISLFFLVDRNTVAYKLTFAGGLMLSIWMIIQWIFVPAYYLLFAVLLVTGLLITLISYQLMGKAIV